jgi:hypothetical protein
MDEVDALKNRTTIAACMLILRANLEKGNQQITQALKETKHDKTKTYDKIIAMILDNCYTTINEYDVSNVLKPENFMVWSDSYEPYVQFNKNVFQIIGPEPKLTSSEKFIKDDIEKVVKKPGIEPQIQEEKLDFFTQKLGKYKYLSYGMIAGFSISIFLGIIYSLFISK